MDSHASRDPALLSALLPALVLSALEGFLSEGWVSLRVWDLSPNHQLLVTTSPCWLVTLWFALGLAFGGSQGTSRPTNGWRLFLAACCLAVVVLPVTLAFLGFKKLGHFLRYDHVRFGAENLIRVLFHLLQTAPLSVFTVLCLLMVACFALLLAAKHFRVIKLRNSGVLVFMGSFVFLGIAHWFCGFLAGSWPKSSWGTLLPEPRGINLAHSSIRHYAHWVARASKAPELQTPQKKYCVIVVLVESLRWDVLKEHPQFVPFLRKLSQEGILLDKAYTPATHSDYSDLSVWYSRYPLLSGARKVWRADDPRRGVSAFAAFKALGYKTAYISSQNEKWGNMIAWLKVPEVDYFFHSEDFGGTTWENWDDLPGLVSLIKKGVTTAGKVEDSETLRVALKWLDSQGTKQPFFLGLNLQNTHFHYVYPPNPLRPLQPDEMDFPAVYYTWPKEKRDVVVNRYLNAVYNLDRLLEEFSNGLTERGLWDNCFFVVAGDNGEAFYEHGFGNHSGPMYEECVRTLVVIKPPREVKVSAPENPANLIDLIPGIMDLLGVVPPGDFQGVSPFIKPHPRPEVFLHSYGFVLQDGIIAWPWKVLLTRWPEDKQELYHLEMDPQERENLWEKYPMVARELTARLVRFREEQLAYWLYQENWSAYFPPRFTATGALSAASQSRQ